MVGVEQPGLRLISGRAHPKLAAEIADCLGVELTQTNITNFANGEISCHLRESVRGTHVFVVQAHCGQVNDAIMEQALLIDAARRASALSITAVCPIMGYTRQDRRASGREPIAARVVVDLLATAGADRIMSVDLHSGQIQGFFSGPFDHLIARPILQDYLAKNLGPTDELVIVSPDAGRVKSAERYANALGSEIAIVHKQRSYVKHNVAEAKYLIGNIKGKDCVVIDDMIDTAGTICAAADLLAKKGARKIYGVATHGILSDPACERIEQSAFSKVIVTNSACVALPKKARKIEVLSVAPLLAQAISAVYAGSSVSALFDGENQI